MPVGTFCSGGVDSSLVTALAAKLKGEPVNTFSVGFDEEDFDESAYARMVSNHYRTVHHELRVGNVKYNELFPADGLAQRRAAGLRELGAHLRAERAGQAARHGRADG